MLNPEKDDTDTEYAIREAIRRGAMEIVVIGATGTRIDHVLGNISLLGIGLEEQITSAWSMNIMVFVHMIISR